LAIVTNVGRNAVDALAPEDEGRESGRRSRVGLISRRWYQAGDDASHYAGDGGNKARSPGRARRKPLKPLRRECRRCRANLWWLCSCAFFICTRGCGRAGAPGIPCALCFGAKGAKLGPVGSRDRGCMLFGIL